MLTVAENTRLWPALSRSGLDELPVGEMEMLTLGVRVIVVLPESVVLSANVTRAVTTMLYVAEKLEGATYVALRPLPTTVPSVGLIDQLTDCTVPAVTVAVRSARPA